MEVRISNYVSPQNVQKGMIWGLILFWSNYFVQIFVGRPVTEYSSDSTYKASTTGPSGVPHTSYSHTTSGFSSENPYKNRTSTYSYNI